MDKKYMAVIAVVAIVIIAVAAFMILNNNSNARDDDPNDPTTHITETDMDRTSLGALVFGNANGDYVIDDDDLDIIANIIDGKSGYTLDKYPLADANANGVVNNNDYNMVKRMIAKESMIVYIIDDSNNSNGKSNVVPSHYPVTKAFVAGNVNMRALVAAVDFSDVIVANATNDTISEPLDSKLIERRATEGFVQVTTGGTSDDQIKLAAVDFQMAIIENSGMTGYSADALLDLYEKKDAYLIQFKTDSTDTYLNTMGTLGVLTSHEASAKKYADLYEKVISDIKSKEGNKFGTVTVMSVVMTNSVSGIPSDYYRATLAAGGNNLADFTTSTKKFPDASDKTWLLDPKYNPQYLIHFSSVKLGEQPASKTISAIKTNFSETNAYQNGDYYVVNGIVPLPVRLAYTASIMYNDLVTTEYADSIFTEYLKDFVGSDKTADDFKIVWNTEELNALIK